jgi:hypothetical protein
MVAFPIVSADQAAWAVAAGAVAFGLFQTVRLRWLGGRAGRRLRRKTTRALVGETRAAGLLERSGYALVARQPVQRWEVDAGGRTESVLVRADYVVERGGRTFVAEVKTGDDAPSVTERATRRQLLEYLCAFDADGVLLVDPESQRVEEVRFALPTKQVTRTGPIVLAFVIGLVAGAVGVIGVQERQARAGRGAIARVPKR